MLPLIDARIKNLATEAFSDNAKRSAMTDEEREEAARFYDTAAKQTVGTNAALAARYNNERAAFCGGKSPTSRELHWVLPAKKRKEKLVIKHKSLLEKGQQVALKDDYPPLNLWKGDTGTVWALYQTEPPAYEATFSLPNGETLDMTVGENEITAAVETRISEPLTSVLAASAAATG